MTGAVAVRGWLNYFPKATISRRFPQKIHADIRRKTFICVFCGIFLRESAGNIFKKKALRDVVSGKAERISSSRLFSFRLLFLQCVFLDKFRTAVAVRAAPDFSALGFCIAFAHE